MGIKIATAFIILLCFISCGENHSPAEAIDTVVKEKLPVVKKEVKEKKIHKEQNIQSEEKMMDTILAEVPIDTAIFVVEEEFVDSAAYQEAEREVAVDSLKDSEKDSTFSHIKFDQLLKKYVNNSGNINYNGLKRGHDALKEYIKELELHVPNDSSSRNVQLAYWLNAYNAHTLNLILKNYPLESITELYDGEPWDQKLMKVEGSTLTLNEIENEIIRSKFNDPRVHFALNCAAQSCPGLMNEAFSSEKLEMQLDKQTRNFINNTKRNSISPESVSISQIFEWYQADFEAGGSTLIDFLNHYSKIQIKSDAEILFNEYNWLLNE